MKSSTLFKFILGSTIGFTGWHMGFDWLDSSGDKPFDPVKATHLRRELLQIKWGQVGLCSRFSIDYNSKTQRCGNRGPLYKRAPTP